MYYEPELYFYNLEKPREFCNFCQTLLDSQRTYSHENRDDYGSPYYIIEIFEIFLCPSCDEVTLIYYYSFGNEDDDLNRNDENYELFRKYHRTVLHAPNKQFHHAIPQSIAEVTRQAQSVLFKSPRASFILCRAVLEEICNHFEIPSERINSKGYVNLNQRLNQLFEQEKMSKDLKDIIQGIRELGNEGAHSDHLTFTKQVNVEDAGNLLMLVNYVIERLYVDKYQQKTAEEALRRLKDKILKPAE